MVVRTREEPGVEQGQRQEHGQGAEEEELKADRRGLERAVKAYTRMLTEHDTHPWSSLAKVSLHVQVACTHARTHAHAHARTHALSTHAHTYTHTHTHAHIHTYTHTRAHTRTTTHTHIHARARSTLGLNAP